MIDERNAEYDLSGLSGNSGSQVNDEPSVVDLSDLRFGKDYDRICQGTSVVNIPDCFALDRLFDHFRYIARRGFKYPKQPQIYVDLGISPSEYVEKSFKRRRFNGKIESIESLLLPPDVAMLGPDACPDHAFSLLSSLALSSTGRGVIGTFVFETTFGWVNSGRPHFSTFHRQLSGEGGKALLDDLITSSAVQWEESQREALRNQVYAGLPTLGKRR